MEKIIVLNKLYILSGLSGSGKTYFLKNLINSGLSEESIIDVKKLSQNILGIPKVDYAYTNIKKNGFQNIIKEILDIRLSQNMTTFIDDFNLSEEIRNEYIQIAKEHGMEYEVLIFKKDLDILFERKNISDKDFLKQTEKFKEITIFPSTYIEENINYIVKPNLLTTEKIDVIGDVHGLLDELKILLQKKEWLYDELNKNFYHADKERKLLFLGDILDRGTQSIELLEVIKNTCNKNQAVLLLGNHEEKLLSAYKRYEKNGIFSFKSLSASQTLVAFLKLPQQKKNDLYLFLNNCQVRNSIWIDKTTLKATMENGNNFKIGFCHANNDFFDENFMPRSLSLYGSSNVVSKDTDETYHKNYLNGINEHILMRGHTNQTSKQDTVFSLEDDQAFKGNLILLSLDNYIKLLKNNNWIPQYSFFERKCCKI